jgi:hypothetical protein
MELAQDGVKYLVLAVLNLRILLSDSGRVIKFSFGLIKLVLVPKHEGVYSGRGGKLNAPSSRH